jgi:hypothetical protein
LPNRKVRINIAGKLRAIETLNAIGTVVEKDSMMKIKGVSIVNKFKAPVTGLDVVTKAANPIAEMIKQIKLEVKCTG